jgi:hypothetical protein
LLKKYEAEEWDLDVVWWVKVKVMFTLEQATKAQMWSRGMALLFLEPQRYMRWMVNASPRPLYPR